MQIRVQATEKNTKSILDLLEAQGICLPCNCHGANVCGGKQYDFPCNLIPKKDMTVSIPDSGAISGLSLDSATNTEHLPDTLLIDLGTTTIAMVFFNSTHKTVFHSCVFANPQISHGADVISRIKYSIEHSNDPSLKNLVQKELHSRYEYVLFRHKDKNLKIKRCLIGGNTTMIHLLCGFPTEGLARAPFTPHSVNSSQFFQQKGTMEIIIIPWLSAFIGGDVVSGLFYLEFDKRSDTCLLADLGTNGELALLHSGHIYTASTAAGPAFEGAGLSCGCPAISGAISNVTWNKIRPKLQTIENKLPIGICGSGAICILSELLTHGFMDSSGILTEKFPNEGLFLCSTPQGKNLYFSPNDVRQMQLAIAAISAGIDTLCHKAGIHPSQIDHLFLAGGLGYHINIKKAAMTGLFSDVPISHIQAVGNSCLLGLADISPESNHVLNRLGNMQKISEEIVLAESSYFQEHFIQHMSY